MLWSAKGATTGATAPVLVLMPVSSEDERNTRTRVLIGPTDLERKGVKLVPKKWSKKYKFFSFDPVCRTTYKDKTLEGIYTSETMHTDGALVTTREI